MGLGPNRETGLNRLGHTTQNANHRMECLRFRLIVVSVYRMMNQGLYDNWDGWRKKESRSQKISY